MRRLVGSPKRPAWKWIDKYGDPKFISFPTPITMKSLKALATASDCVIDTGWDTSWANAHDAASGVVDTADLTPRTAFDAYGVPVDKWLCQRGFPYFDTSLLTPSDTLIKVVLGLYIYSKQYTNVGHANLHIVEGVQHDPPVATDFGDSLIKVTSGGNINYDDIVEEAFNEIVLNATGMAWINKGGITKLCLKLSGDIDNLEPTGPSYGNAILINVQEDGSDYAPYLYIDYY